MTQKPETAYRELDAAYEAAAAVTDGFELIGHLARLTRLDRAYREALKASAPDLPAMTDDELLAALGEEG